MNTVSTQRRKYVLKVRAERQRRTRERIVAATLALHREVGPARTTIKDIARRAGVQRLTVYNAFPDPADLFIACQHLFLEQHPPPVPRTAGTNHPMRDLRDTLMRRYAWYRANRALQEKVHRDRHLLPDLDALMARTTDARLDDLADAQARALHAGRRARSVRAIVRLALAYPSWELLADRGIGDTTAATLMVEAVAGVLRGDDGGTSTLLR